MLALMVDLEDGDEALIEWSVADESNEDDDEEANHVIGENSIDRFACALGGKIVLPEVMKHVPQMLNNGMFLISCKNKSKQNYYSF